MAKLTAQRRKHLPSGQFGLIEHGQRKYPMPDTIHAIEAKARAKQQLKKRNLSRDEYDTIVAKANRVLKRR